MLLAAIRTLPDYMNILRNNLITQISFQQKHQGSTKSLVTDWLELQLYSYAVEFVLVAEMWVHVDLNNSFITENSELSASINITGDQICVSCPDDGVSRGCVIVLRHSQELQSTMSYEILRSEGEGCFRQEKSGDYTVAVFKQTMNKTLHAIPLKVSVVSVSFSIPITRKLL